MATRCFPHTAGASNPLQVLSRPDLASPDLLVPRKHPFSSKGASTSPPVTSPKRAAARPVQAIAERPRGKVPPGSGGVLFPALEQLGRVLRPQPVLHVASAEARVLDVPLLAPFVIASTSVNALQNVAVRLELSTGNPFNPPVVGWGEIPVMPPVTAEDQPTALAAAQLACRWLLGRHLEPWPDTLRQLAVLLPGHQFAAVRMGVEMAIVDAVARSRGLPLWRFFGGRGRGATLTTDITVPICTPAEAAALAGGYRARGFRIIKTKVGGTELQDDIARLKAIRSTHPECDLIIDANGGYTAEEALQVLEELREEGLTPALFEQPVERDDWEGLAQVARTALERYGVPVAADESCRSPQDAQRIAEGGLAQVLNIKLAKCGLLGALEIVDVARGAGLGLMVGGMVETRLAMGFSAHLAAGLGCFEWVDLDTPLLLAEEKVQGGYQACGPRYMLGDEAGHGASLDWSP